MGGLSSGIVCILIPWNGQLLRLLLAVCTTINVITELGICSYCSGVWEWSWTWTRTGKTQFIVGRRKHRPPPNRLRIKLPRQDIIHLSHFPVALFHPPCGCVCSTGISTFPSFPHFHLPPPRRQDFMMSILAFRRWLLKIENHNRINFLHRKLSPLSAKSWISLWLSPIPESRHCTMSEC